MSPFLKKLFFGYVKLRLFRGAMKGKILETSAEQHNVLNLLEYPQKLKTFSKISESFVNLLELFGILKVRKRECQSPN